MGIASLILGIIALLTGWLPFICLISAILAITGLILGIVDTLKKNKTGIKGKGISIAGLVVSAVSIPMIIINSIVTFCAIMVILFDNTSAIERYDIETRQEETIDDWYKDWYERYYNTIDKNDII